MARPSRYPPELRERAVRLVAEVLPNYPSEWPAMVAVAASLLSLNGFAEDAYGQLGWHPAVDLRAAAALCAALVLACAARRGVDRARPEPPAESHVRAMTTITRPAHYQSTRD